MPTEHRQREPAPCFQSRRVVVASLIALLAAQAAGPLPARAEHVAALLALGEPPAQAESSRPAGGRSLADLAREAAAAREAGRAEDAIRLSSAALRLDPSWAEGRWYLATLHYEAGRFADARAGFGAVVETEPSNGAAWGMRGLSAFGLDEFEPALVDLVKARELGLGGNTSLDGTIRYHAGILLTRFGQFEFALKTLSEFARLGNDNPRVIEALGLATLRMPLLPAEISTEARDLVLLAGRAAYLTGAGLTDSAARSFQELVQRFPETAHVHYAVGLFLLNGEPDRAVQHLRRELAISPGHPAAMLQLAVQYIRRSEWREARVWAERTVAADPLDARGRQALGQVLLELGEVDRAIDELEAARHAVQESPTIHFLLARAYQKAGRPADAERARREFVRLDRESRAASHGEQAVGGEAPPR